MIKISFLSKAVSTPYSWWLHLILRGFRANSQQDYWYVSVKIRGPFQLTLTWDYSPNLQFYVSWAKNNESFFFREQRACDFVLIDSYGRNKSNSLRSHWLLPFFSNQRWILEAQFSYKQYQTITPFLNNRSFLCCFVFVFLFKLASYILIKTAWTHTLNNKRNPQAEAFLTICHGPYFTLSDEHPKSHHQK